MASAVYRWPDGTIVAKCDSCDWSLSLTEKEVAERVDPVSDAFLELRNHECV